MSAIDPVCGMTVESGTAVVRTEFDGHTYYFCSDTCRKRFQSDPGRYTEGGERGWPQRP